MITISMTLTTLSISILRLGIQELDKAIEKCKADDDSRIEMEMAKLKAKERLNYLNKSVRFTPPVSFFLSC